MNKLVFFGCIAMVTLALVGGFMVAGGPGYARLESADRERARDLERWGRYYSCQRDPDIIGGEVLPSGCSGQTTPSRLVDPETGDAYRYTRLDPNSFQVCATFRTEVMRDVKPIYRNSLTFSGDEGCIIYKRSDPTSNWVRQ